jgi:AcrR family transcriptional regulator
MSSMDHRSMTMSAANSAARPDGRTTRWDAHRETRRNQLIDAAIVAVREYGEAVGMDQIAAVANTSKPAIYRYFTDKADLYQAIGQRMAGYLLDLIGSAVDAETDSRARMRAGVDAYLQVLDETPALYRFVVNGTPDGRLLNEFMSLVGALITKQLRADLAQQGVHPDAAIPWSTAIVGFVRAAGDWWLANRDRMGRGQLAEYLTSLLWGGSASLYASAGVMVDVTPPPGVFGPPPPAASPSLKGSR